jgi:hypothetical protein
MATARVDFGDRRWSREGGHAISVTAVAYRNDGLMRRCFGGSVFEVFSRCELASTHGLEFTTMPDLGKTLMVLGAMLVVAGVALTLLGRANLPLGRLPGDIAYRGRNTAFYFPLATSVLVSVVLSLVLYVVGHWRK